MPFITGFATQNHGTQSLFLLTLFFLDRSMRVGYFSQHHVDALSMKQTSLEFFKSNYPGK